MDGGRTQLVVAALGVALAVIIGIFIVMLLADPAQEPSTGSPTLAAIASPTLAGASPTADPTAVIESPSPEPVATGTAPPTAAPTDAPTASPTAPPTTEPTAGVTPTPTLPAVSTVPPTDGASPAPTAVATAPQREVRLNGVGLDAPDAPEGTTPRLITFAMDGPGQISALLSDVSAGRVRICLWRGAPQDPAERECRNARRGGVERTVTDIGQSTWTISLVGATEQTSPSATLVLQFHAHAPAMSLEGFRFAGEAIDNYNGFEAEIAASQGGDVRLNARWEGEDEDAFPYRFIVEEIASPAAPFSVEGGPATSADHSAPVTGGSGYRVTLANSVEIAETSVFLRATLSWP